VRRCDDATIGISRQRIHRHLCSPSRSPHLIKRAQNIEQRRRCAVAANPLAGKQLEGKVVE
jgi:hypothetical protein